MKKVIVLMCLYQFCFGQKLNAEQIQDVTKELNLAGNTMSNTLNFTTFDQRYTGLRGTYYFIPKWLQGDVYGKDKKPIKKNLTLKYDCVNQELVMKNGTDSAAIYPHAFTLFDPDFKATYKFINPSKSIANLPEHFLLVMYEGSYTVLKSVEKKYEKADFRGAYNTVNKTYDSFEDASKYYFVDKNGKASAFKRTKNSIGQLFSDKKEAFKQFWAENLPNPDSDNHLAILFAALDK